VYTSWTDCDEIFKVGTDRTHFEVITFWTQTPQASRAPKGAIFCFDNLTWGNIAIALFTNEFINRLNSDKQ